MNNLTIGETIARGNRDAAIRFLQEYGVPAAGYNTGDLTLAINDVLVMNGEPALKKLMAIHPDRSAIMEYEETAHPRKETHHNCCGSGHHNATGHHNCTGCGGGCGKRSYNADGSGTHSQLHIMDSFNKSAFYMIIGVAAIFGLVMLAKQDKQRA